MLNKSLILKTSAVLLTLAALTTVTVITIPSLFKGPNKKAFDLNIEEDTDLENLKPGVCVNSYFKDLDLSNIKTTEENWNNGNIDFEKNTEINSKGCVAFNSKIKKINAKEDGKARWELALQKGKFGFAVLFSVRNENKKLKKNVVLALLENTNNVWEVKRSIRSTEEIKTNEEELVFINKQDGVLEAEFRLDKNELCGKDECKEGKYSFDNKYFTWKQTSNGKETFSNWNNNSKALVNAIVWKAKDKFPNLVETYFGFKFNKEDNVYKPSSENPTVGGVWTKWA